MKERKQDSVIKNSWVSREAGGRGRGVRQQLRTSHCGEGCIR